MRRIIANLLSPLGGIVEEPGIAAAIRSGRLSFAFLEAALYR